MPDPLLVEAAEKYGIPLGVLEGLALTEGQTWDLVSVRGEVGRLQIHPTHAAAIKEQFGLEWGELRNRPDVQIAYHVPRLARAWNDAKGQGGTDSEAAWAVVLLQAPAEQYRSRQYESIMQALGYPGPNPIPPTSPITTPAGMGGAGDPGPPRRDNPKYWVSDPMNPGAPKMFDEEWYSRDVVAYETALQAPMMTKTLQEGEADQDLGFYFDLVLDQWATEIEAGSLEVAQANVKLNKRLSALDQGRTMYQALLPRSLAPGAEHIPGREPGGLYEQMGLPSEKATTVSVNPMAAALALMGETPEMAAPSDLSFEAAIARAKQLMGEAGVGEPTAALVGAAAPVPPAAARPEVEPPSGWVTPVTPTATEPMMTMARPPGEQLMTPAPPSLAGMTEDDKIHLGKIILAMMGGVPGAPPGASLASILNLLGVSTPVPGALGAVGRGAAIGAGTLADVLKRMRW